MQKPFIRAFQGATPKVDETAFVAETATLIGDIEIGAESSIWYGCVLRGDVNHIRVGARSNIQDGSVVHVTSKTHPTLIGDDVLVGHNAVIHGCTLEDGAFVGMGAIVLDGAVVEGGAMVAAGALVTPNKRVKAGELWAGNPARKMRDLTPEQQAGLKVGTAHYVNVANLYKEEAE